jgi:hypothetical protein
MTGRQGFPMLKQGTRTGEYKSESLLRMSIEGAQLSCDIANASLVHETQGRANELSKQTGNW